MQLLQAREEARRIQIEDNERIVFELLDQEEHIQRCEWIDPASGTFSIEGRSGFSRVDDFFRTDPPIRNQKIVKEE